MLFCCRTCAHGPCELRMPDALVYLEPDQCPANYQADPRWHEIPSGRSTMPRTGLDLLPGPFCEIPATAIARAVAEAGRYTLEIGPLDRLEVPCSRTAFDAAVTAMEEVRRDAVD